MSSTLDLWEIPDCKELYMVAGWHQWADAGAISSGLPEYLVVHYDGRKIGDIQDDGYYLFQIPGTHHFLRPQIKLDEGYRKSLDRNENEFYFVGNEEKGMVVFLGVEPHLNVDRYAEDFFEAASALGVKRVIAVGGVYGAMPYNLDRDVSCVYSLPEMKQEMTNYSVRFSNYEGGATIGSYLLDQGERSGMEYVTFHAFVPAYDFGDEESAFQGIRLENDYRAWHELMRRVNHMCNLGLDLSDLAHLSSELDKSVETKIAELDREMPQLGVQDYMREITREFSETPFAPLDDMWEEELGDLFDEEE